MKYLEKRAAHLQRRVAANVMTAADREMLRENILMQCHAASRRGTPFSMIVEKAKYDGYNVNDDEVDAEIRYLEGKNFIREVSKELSPENRRYLCTADGTDYLHNEGLV